MQEPDNVWDFFSLSPEATHQFTWLFGDRGIPASYRHMDGFGSHTFQWVNSKRAKNYEPNSFGGPQQSNEPLYGPIEVQGLAGSFAGERHPEDNDFVQAGNLYRVMSEEAKQRLVENIAGSLARVSRDEIIERSIGHFRKADPDYGRRVAEAITALRK